MNFMNYIKNTNVPMLAMLIFLTRIVIFGAGIGDSIAMLGLCALFAYDRFIQIRKEDVLKNIDDQFQKLSNEISSLRMQVNPPVMSTMNGKKRQEPKRNF